MNHATTEVKKEMTKEVSIEKVNVDGKVKATITTTSDGTQLQRHLKELKRKFQQKLKSSKRNNFFL